jgi:hypothetical protein
MDVPSGNILCKSNTNIIQGLAAEKTR